MSTRDELRKKTDEHIEAIRQCIMDEGTKFRARHPLIAKYQSIVGLSILLTACLVTCACIYSFAMDETFIPYWTMLFPTVVFATSIIHEIEHDVIHSMYFSQNHRDFTFMSDVMMVLCWVFRPNTINGFSRKVLHLHHHIASGTETDLEERGITNGEAFGLKRFFMLLDPLLSKLLRGKKLRKIAISFAKMQVDGSQHTEKEMRHVFDYMNFPIHSIHSLIVYPMLLAKFVSLCLGVDVAAYFTQWASSSSSVSSSLVGPSVLHTIFTAAHVYFYALALPNMLRSIVLYAVSSNMHYFGIDPGNVVTQTQVLDKWFLLPADFCTFGFGRTHCHHHFVTRDPFYIRTAIASACYPTMKKHGVRFNDFASMTRGNAW